MDRFGKLLQLKAVLEKGGHFDGIYRKVQLKPLKFRTKVVGDKTETVVEEALLILKWGGQLTHAGIQQAEKLGKSFRVNIYPSSKGLGLLRLHSTYRHDLKCYSSDEGRCLMTSASFLKGLLDLDGELTPILSSMVIQHEGAQELLGDSEKSSEEQKMIKNHMNNLLNYMDYSSDIYMKTIGVPPSDYYRDLMKQMQNPVDLLKQINSLITEYTVDLSKLISKSEQTESYLILKYPVPRVGSFVELSLLLKEEANAAVDNAKEEKKQVLINQEGKKPDSSIQAKYEERMKKINMLNEEEKERLFGCEKESCVLMYKRWKKLEKDFYSHRNERYDISKIQDINDGIRYDVIHNSFMMNDSRRTLCKVVSLINQFVTPLEFGFTIKQKLNSAVKVFPCVFTILRNSKAFA